ncbi:hypothetical protein L7F22_053031, partial [Adiantum nelumboides]|nr:hypothetical protein [Adiantum nelumboides]
ENGLERDSEKEWKSISTVRREAFVVDNSGRGNIARDLEGVALACKGKLGGGANASCLVALLVLTVSQKQGEVDCLEGSAMASEKGDCPDRGEEERVGRGPLTTLWATKRRHTLISGGKPERVARGEGDGAGCVWSKHERRRINR